MYLKRYLLLALVLFCAFLGIGTQPVLSQNSQGQIIDFTVRGLGDTWFYRHPDSQHPISVGYDFQFSAQATVGPVGIIAYDTETGTSSLIGKSDSNSITLTISTIDYQWDDRLMTFCGAVQGDSLCTTIQIVPGRGCTPLNEGGDGCPFDFPEYGPFTYFKATDDGMAPPANSGPLQIGDRVRVTAGTSNRLRSGPGTNYEQIGTLEAFTPLTLLDGPMQGGGYTWYEVQLDDGTTGYTASSDGSEMWLEKISGGNAPVAPTAAPPPGRRFVAAPCGNLYVDGCIAGAAPEEAEIVYINGIMNAPEDFRASMALIEATFPNTKVMGIYNDGLSMNQGLVERRGVAWATLKDYLLYLDRPIIVMGHSQGGAVISIALQALPERRLQDINKPTIYVFTFGSPATGYPVVTDESIITYRHCAFQNDPVVQIPLLAGLVNRIIPWGQSDTPLEHGLEDYFREYDYCQ